jgi:Glycosyltransferase 61
MPPTSRPLHLTIKTNAGSCEHFYHFLLGYLLPLAAYIVRRGIPEDRAILLRDCGPLDHILRELALPGLLLCERLTHASIRKTLQHSPWAETDEIKGFDLGHLPGEESYYDAASIGIGVRFLRKRLAPAIETAKTELNASWTGSPRVLMIERGEADPFYDSSVVEVKSSANQRRSIGNHAEVAACLAAGYPGFRSVRLETTSLAEQVAWFELTDILVAQHGAALSNMIWMRPGAHVIEIDPDTPSGVRILFRRLAEVCEVSYACLRQAAGTFGPVEELTTLVAAAAAVSGRR